MSIGEAIASSKNVRPYKERSISVVLRGCAESIEKYRLADASEPNKNHALRGPAGL